MTNRIRRSRLWLLLWGVVLAGAACASQPEKKPIMTVEEYEKNTPEPATWQDPCTDDEGRALECQSNADCCEGRVCSKDPERSQRLTYCVEI